MPIHRMSPVLMLLVAMTTTDSAGASVSKKSTAVLAHESRTGRFVRQFPQLAALSEPLLERLVCASSLQRKRLSGKLDRLVVRAAQRQVNLPMGSGRFESVGGRRYLFCLEPHYHEPGSGLGPDGWHKGVTVYDAN